MIDLRFWANISRQWTKPIDGKEIEQRDNARRYVANGTSEVPDDFMNEDYEEFGDD